jgi:oxygen-independent coproporphyrinogen-3 oxidase
LEAAGFDHYEISNYARPDRRAVHNGVYWSGAPYVGLGPSAHSFDGETRRWNVRDWARYETIVCGDADPVENAEHLTPAQQRLERVLLGLRTVAGVEAASSGSFPSWLREAVAAGWVQAHDGSLRLTPVGWLRIDELLPRLTTFLEGG